MGKKYLGRVGAMIRFHVTRLLLESSNDERLMQVNITDVVVNRDTTRAEIFYSILGPAEERVQVQAALDRAAGWLRSELAPVSRLRNLPQLVFAYDPSLEQGERIEALLNQLQADGILTPAAPTSAEAAAPKPDTDDEWDEDADAEDWEDDDWDEDDGDDEDGDDDDDF